MFGAIRSESGTGAAGNEWRFTGEQRDPQASRNFYYLRARYYDPGIGRLLSQDPIPGGNLYSYVGNNPVNYTDPSGKRLMYETGGGYGQLYSYKIKVDIAGGVVYVVTVSASGAVIAVEQSTGAISDVASAGGNAIAGGAEEVWGGVSDLFGKKPLERDRDRYIPRQDFRDPGLNFPPEDPNRFGENWINYCTTRGASRVICLAIASAVGSFGGCQVSNIGAVIVGEKPPCPIQPLR